MKDKIKNYISIMKLIDETRLKNGWQQCELSVRSGVSTGNISKFLNEEIVRETGFGRNANNLLSVLVALDLIKPEKEIKEACLVNCGDDIKKLCAEVKEIIESKTHWADSLESNIHSFRAGVERDKNDPPKKAKNSPTLHRPTKKPHGGKKAA